MTKEIELTRGKVALVSDHRFGELSKYRWFATTDGWHWYAARSTGKTLIMMHRQIMGVTERKQQVDHIDGNGLNNQDENLRVCSCSENGRNRKMQKNNTTGYKGVCRKRKSFTATVKLNKKVVYRATFPDPVSAAYAYDNAARKFHGNFASLNFPNEYHDPQPITQRAGNHRRLRWRLEHIREHPSDLAAIRFALDASDAEIDARLSSCDK